MSKSSHWIFTFAKVMYLLNAIFDFIAGLFFLFQLFIFHEQSTPGRNFFIAIGIACLLLSIVFFVVYWLSKRQPQ